MRYRYQTKGTCSHAIEFDFDENIVSNVQFTGGCHGNAQGVSKLAEGMTGDQIVSKLSGIRCEAKNTSCPDQFAQAIAELMDKE